MKEKVVLLPWCWSYENSVVTGNSESITPSEVLRGNTTVEFIARHIGLTGKQIDFSKQGKVFAAVQFGNWTRVSEIGSKRSNLCAIPDPLKFHCLPSDLVFVWKGMFVLCLRDVNSRTNSARNCITVAHGTWVWISWNLAATSTEWKIT